MLRINKSMAHMHMHTHAYGGKNYSLQKERKCDSWGDTAAKSYTWHCSLVFYASTIVFEDKHNEMCITLQRICQCSTPPPCDRTNMIGRTLSSDETFRAPESHFRCLIIILQDRLEEPLNLGQCWGLNGLGKKGGTKATA